MRITGAEKLRLLGLCLSCAGIYFKTLRKNSCVEMIEMMVYLKKNNGDCTSASCSFSFSSAHLFEHEQTESLRTLALQIMSSRRCSRAPLTSKPESIETDRWEPKCFGVTIASRYTATPSRNSTHKARNDLSSTLLLEQTHKLDGRTSSVVAMCGERW